MLDASQYIQHPHTSVCSCTSMFWGYLLVIWGYTPCGGGLGASAYLSGFWCLSVHPLDVHYASSCTSIIRHYHCFLQFVWHNVPYQWKVLPFGMATAPQVFTTLTKSVLFLCLHKGFCIVVYLDDILVLVHSKQAGQRACSFLCSLLVWLGLHINFSKSDLHLTQTFCF